MKQLLMLVPLTVLALAAAAEAQPQAGGLPDVSSRVQVLETRVNSLQTLNAALQAAIKEEVEKRQAAEAEIQAALKQENAQRQATEAEIQAAINEEIQKRQTADTGLQTAINEEIQKRQTADTGLQTTLDKETFERKIADTALEEQFDVFGRVLSVSVPTAFLVQGQMGTVATLAPVPPGRYLVIAKANVENGIHIAQWHCFLFQNDAQLPNFLDSSTTSTVLPVLSVFSTVNMVAVTTVFEPGSFRVDCQTLENGSDLSSVKIVAVSVQ